MRESKGFVDISKNVVETLSMKYGPRFPRGIATFATAPPPPLGYTQALIKCETSVGVTDCLSTRREEAKKVPGTFPKASSWQYIFKAFRGSLLQLPEFPK